MKPQRIQSEDEAAGARAMPMTRKLRRYITLALVARDSKLFQPRNRAGGVGDIAINVPMPRVPKLTQRTIKVVAGRRRVPGLVFVGPLA